MFQVESIKGNTVTVRHGVLTFKVYIGDNGFVEVPKRVWIDDANYEQLIYVVKVAYYKAESIRKKTNEESIYAREYTE